MTTDVVWHPACRLHQAGAGHPERPERIAAVWEALRGPAPAAVVEWVEAVPAPRGAPERGPPPPYPDAGEALAAPGGGPPDAHKFMGGRTRGAGAAAAGGPLA